MDFLRRLLGALAHMALLAWAPAAHVRVLLGFDTSCGTWGRITSKAAKGSTRICLCPTAPVWDLGCVHHGRAVPHRTAEEPPLPPGPGAVSVCGSEAPREPRPDALRPMGPRFISLFPGHGNFCLLPLSNFPSQTVGGTIPSPAPLSIPAGEAAPFCFPFPANRGSLKKEPLKRDTGKTGGQHPSGCHCRHWFRTRSTPGRRRAGGCPAGAASLPLQHAGTSLPHPASPAAAAADTPVWRHADLLYNLAPESLCKAPDCAPNDCRLL